MKNFDSRVYSVSDFLEWNNSDLLELSPDFQRRAVWSEKAKSYLVDTIIRGKPIPKILITQELQGSRTIRIVVDGQQRLRAILDFLDGAFKIARAHNKEYAGLTYERLPPDIQRDFLKYELGVDLLFDMSYEDILDVFARLNSYTVKLNKQELLNATYFGYFKQAAYAHGYKYVRYFIEGGILKKAAVTRMAEAELAADLLMSLVGGVQTNKNVERYYKTNEDTEEPLPERGAWFDEIMSYIGSIYPPMEISETNWSRVHLFYTLFTAIGHCLFGLNNLDPDLRVRITPKLVRNVRVILDEISNRFDEIAANINDPNAPKDYKDFIDKARRGTTDTSARVFRANFVCRKLKDALL